MITVTSKIHYLSQEDIRKLIAGYFSTDICNVKINVDGESISVEVTEASSKETQTEF